jgi:septal ring factor EnvC (AmiA/AmiB activator)
MANKKDALAKAQEKFKKAQEALAEKKKELTKSKRILATGDKKLNTLEKKINEAKSAPEKAVEILLKKAEELEAQAAAIAPELEETAAKAAEVESQLEEKQAELQTTQEESKAKLKELGVSTSTRRVGVSTGGRRARNNFIYKLKTKGWVLSYNAKKRISGASKHGLVLDCGPEEFTVTGGSLKEPLTHTYGQGALVFISDCVKNYGTEDMEDAA